MSGHGGIAPVKEKAATLTKVQRRYLTLVIRAGGAYLDRSLRQYFILNGRVLPERTARRLILNGYLVPVGDSLFPGDTQSYVAAGHA